MFVTSIWDSLQIQIVIMIMRMEFLFQGNADFGEKYPTTRKWCNAPTKIAHAEDILISVRAPIGALNYAKEECCIGRGLAAITPNQDKVSSGFIYWLLKGKHKELNLQEQAVHLKLLAAKC